jgi:hypothetical protein
VRKDLDDALVRDFPLLYVQRGGSIQQTCMAWGFECNDGWAALIRRLSERLEPLIAAQSEDERACASQVKEKFGTLSFYMYGATDEMAELVREAELESEVTCEICGEPGVLRGQYWLFTACDKHARRGPAEE